MNINDIRSKTDKELFGMINKLKAELLALRFQVATGQLDTPHEIKNVKKDIARVYTVIAENNSGIIVEPKKENIKSKKATTKPEPKVEVKKATVKTTAKKTTAKKTITKPAVKKPTTKKAATKPAVKKTTAKKTTAKKAPAKKAKGASK